MKKQRNRQDRDSFGMGQHGGERLDVELGSRHGQPEKGDAVREPRQGRAGSGRPSSTPKRRKKK